MKIITSKLVVPIMLTLSLGFMAWVLWLCQFGVDLTDEGFYLNTLRNPKMYLETTSYFGFVYQIMFKILGGNVIELRQVMLILLLIISWLISYQLLARYRNQSSLFNVDFLAISLALSSSVLMVYATWLPTPNYNLLNIFALLLISFATLRLNKLFKNPCYLEFSLIFIGGILSALSKPSSAALVFILYVSLAIIVFYKHKLIRNNLIKTFLVTAPIFFIIFIIVLWGVSGSLEGTIASLKQGLENGNLLSGKQRNPLTLLWRGAFNINSTFVIFSTVFCILVISIIYTLKGKFTAFKLLFSDFIIFIVGASLGISVFLGFAQNPFSKLRLSDQAFLILLISLTVISISLMQKREANRKRLLTFEITFLIFLLPYVYVFGTSNNYYNAIALGGIFFVIGTSFFLVRANDSQGLNLLRKYSILCLLFAFLSVHEGITKPYRQPAGLMAKTNEVINEGGLAGLKVEPKVASYFNKIYTDAYENGFISGTTLIDMSGASPTVAYSLDANSVGAAWYIGGYPGSTDRAIRSLSKGTEAELKSAWILSEPNYKRALNNIVLKRFGLDLQKDYELVSEFFVPAKFGSRRKESLQKLYKPIQID